MDDDDAGPGRTKKLPGGCNADSQSAVTIEHRIGFILQRHYMHRASTVFFYFEICEEFDMYLFDICNS
jgi:hypothetical protein